MGPPASYRVTRVRYYSGVTRAATDFVYGSFTLCALLFQNSSTILPECHNGDPQPPGASTWVWPLPRSLAATWRIDVSFSSWGYLDVSVHPVSVCMLWIHMQMHTYCSMRVPPFGNLRFIRYLLLTAAYRSLSRPSSASGAKASALCSFLLDQVRPDLA